VFGRDMTFMIPPETKMRLTNVAASLYARDTLLHRQPDGTSVSD
jgi:hypothetical protein